MITPTHLVAAQTGYLAACLMLGHPPTPGEATVALVVSQLPDIDTPTSYAGRLIPPLSEWIEHQFGHRTITHSAIVTAAAILAAWWWLPIGYTAAISAGLLSHALGDMMTKTGVCWLWPSLARCVFPGNSRYRVEVAGYPELWILIASIAIGIAIMPLAESGRGPSGLIRSAIGSIAAARDEFDASKGEFAYQLEIRGRDNRSYADISGLYPVIGPYHSAGFLLSTPAGPVSVCRSESDGIGGCDWYAEKARLERGQPQQTTSHTIMRHSIQAATLSDALAPLEAVGDVFLLGEATIPEVKPNPPMLIASGNGHATFNYAGPDTMRALADAGHVLLDAQLTVQIRHAPGVEIPELALPDETGVSLDPLIKRWITP